MDVKASYQFAEIPNNEEGRAFIAEMKKYLNPRYKIRVRGQHLNQAGKNIGWRYFQYGQSMEFSDCLRVYIQEAKR